MHVPTEGEYGIGSVHKCSTSARNYQPVGVSRCKPYFAKMFAFTDNIKDGPGGAAPGVFLFKKSVQDLDGFFLIRKPALAAMLIFW